MSERTPAAFISYSRADSEFVMRLTADLKQAGASVWLDQVDIQPGERWDHVIEGALDVSPLMLVILSSNSVESMNVMDEVSFALEKQKTVIPIVIQDCSIPFRLRRIQYADFRVDYAHGFNSLLGHLGAKSAAPVAPPAASSAGDAEDARRKLAEPQAQAEAERQKSELAEAQQKALAAQHAAEREAQLAAEAKQTAAREKEEQEQAKRAAQATEDAKQTVEIKASVAPPPAVPVPAAHPPTAKTWAAPAAYITVIPAILFLLAKPYNQIPLVRFHACQSIAFSLCAVVAQSVGYMMGAVFFLMINLALFILWLVAIVKASKGEWFKLPVIGNVAANWAKVSS